MGRILRIVKILASNASNKEIYLSDTQSGDDALLCKARDNKHFLSSEVAST